MALLLHARGKGADAPTAADVQADAPFARRGTTAGDRKSMWSIKSIVFASLALLGAGAMGWWGLSILHSPSSPSLNRAVNSQLARPPEQVLSSEKPNSGDKVLFSEVRAANHLRPNQLRGEEGGGSRLSTGATNNVDKDGSSLRTATPFEEELFIWPAPTTVVQGRGTVTVGTANRGIAVARKVESFAIKRVLVQFFGGSKVDSAVAPFATEALHTVCRYHNNVTFGFVTSSDQESDPIIRKDGTFLVTAQTDLSLPCGEDADFVLGVGRDLPFGVNEGYTLTLEILEDSQPPIFVAALRSCSTFGLIRGIASVAQVLEQVLEHGRISTLPLTIEDHPRFRVRGLLLDTGRAYFTPQEIKRIIHGMSLLKLNYLHWHITDDQSFPLEIKGYPSLHSAGAGWLGYIHNRENSLCRQLPKRFYSHDEVADIVDFAKSRAIRVVPEIDMPAHARSWGIGNSKLTLPCPNWVRRASAGRKGEYTVNLPLNVTSREVLKVVEIVLGEASRLFPDPWFHIGGDEVPKDCLQESGFGSSDPVLAFQRHVRQFLNSRGKSGIVVWDDSLPFVQQSSLDDVVVHEWHGEESIKRVVEQSTYVIQSGRWYFDLASACANAISCRQTRAVSLPQVKEAWRLGAVACAWELTPGNCTSTENGGDVWERQFDRRVWGRLIGAAAEWWEHRDATSLTARLNVLTNLLRRAGYQVST